MNRYLKTDFIQNGCISAEKKHLNGEVTTHWHDFYELEYIVSGEGSYIIDGVCYPIKPGLLFFMTPLNFHSVDIKNTQLYNIMFSGNICNLDCMSQLASKSPVVMDCNENVESFLIPIMNELIEQQGNTDFAGLLLNALLSKINIHTKTNSETASSPIKKLELYILNNFRSKLTLDDASKYIMLSPGYVSQQFKKETGKNFKAYLNDMRYDYAEKLLTFSDMTVSEICNECGFDDYPNFIRRFKQHKGMYPGEYRKKHKINATFCPHEEYYL